MSFAHDIHEQPCGVVSTDASKPIMARASVHALSTGRLTLPERFFISPADPEARNTVPSLSFLIQHKSDSGRLTRIVFDLGLRRDTRLYPEVLQKHIASRQPVSTEPDVVASLKKGHLKPEEIDFVIFSHVHYDHVGMPRDFTNPRTKFIIGAGASDLLSGRSTLDIGGHCHFETDLLPPERTIELPDTDDESTVVEISNLAPLKWTDAVPPFPHAMDLFGDGLVYILSAPGHLPGHINLLVRISLNPPEYVVLAGDACHDVRLFTGERDIATWTDDQGRTCCIHYDIPRAKETIVRLRDVQNSGLKVCIDGQKQLAQVEVVFAHNWAWEEDARKNGRFWPGSL